MKKNIFRLASFIFGCAAIVSCVDDNYMELDKGHNELTLSVNAQEIVLNEAEHANDALALTWTTGTNFGTGNKIYYTLEIAKAGTEFAAPFIAVDYKTQTYEYKATVEKLNETLRSFFGEEETLSLEARVTAVVPEKDELQSSVTSFNVTTYKPVTSTLFIIGDATSTGWDKDKMAEMKRLDNGIFTWTGKLLGGKSFKFLVSKDDWVPSYNKGVDGQLVYRASYDDPDEAFTIEETGNYVINVNLLAMTLDVQVSAAETPLFDSMYLIGNMTEWSFEPLTLDAIDPFLFRMGRFFDKGGDFKFATSNGNWENNFKAPYAEAPYTETRAVFVSGYDPDDKWKLQDSEINKAYKICFDIRKDRERMLMQEFVPYEMIYLVGSASPAGWSIDSATPMTPGSDAYTFTWEGTLNEGELKFTCDKQSDWMGAWFMASEGGKNPTGETEQMLFIDKSSDWCKNQYLDVNVGDLDQKWQISESGNYVITLNQLKETVSIVKK